MKAKGKFISFLLVVDTFFVAYAYGFHSRQVLVVDPKLPPVVHKKNMEKIEKNDSAGKAIVAGKAAVVKPLSKHESKKHESKKVSANNDKSAKEQLAKNEKPVTAEKQTKAVSANNKTTAAKSTKQATKQAEKKSP
ncbi:hypothetical protein KBI23_17380 [bacterium]|nr:hypothetical protein [bacterium]MBP9809900.1 hypothetical protein [bacterium]